ncbi:MAG: hypothetical protein AB1938_16050 [Myxococcota bacterium]
MPSLFLDTNLYSYASNEGQVDRVRAWLDRNGFTAVASILNLIELARTGDRGQAVALVRALTRIAREQEEPPFTALLTDEFLTAAKTQQPQWVQAGGWATRSNRLRSYRQKWEAVRAAPEQAFVGLADFDREHQPLEQGLYEQQTKVAKAQRDRDVISVEVVVPPALRTLVGDQLADRVDRLPSAERFVRLASLEDWVAALFPSNRRPNDLRNWIDGHLKPMKERALATFWLADVGLNAVPHHAVRGLVRHLQPTRTVKDSNRNDLDQANWLLRVDLVLTADKRFLDLLLQAREQLRSWVPNINVARLGLVKPAADTLTAVQQAIAEAR